MQYLIDVNGVLTIFKLVALSRSQSRRVRRTVHEKSAIPAATILYCVFRPILRVLHYFPPKMDGDLANGRAEM